MTTQEKVREYLKYGWINEQDIQDYIDLEFDDEEIESDLEDKKTAWEIEREEEELEARQELEGMRDFLEADGWSVSEMEMEGVRKSIIKGKKEFTEEKEFLAIILLGLENQITLAKALELAR